jgi:chromosome segregation protein
VVDEINHAISLARKYRYSLRIVTLDGEQLNPGGSMSGGAFKNNSNLLGRRRELDELEKNLGSYQTKREQLTKAIVENRENRHALTAEIEQIQSVLQEQLVLQNTIGVNLETAGNRKQELESSYTDFKRETGEIDSQLESLQENSTRLQDDLQDAGDRNTWLENEITRLTEQLQNMREEEAEQGKTVEEIRLSITSAKNHHDFIMENIKRLMQELEELQAEYEAVQEDNKDTVSEIDARVQAIEALKHRAQEQEAQITAWQAEIDQATQNKESQMQEHKEFFHKREEISGRVTALDRELYRLSGQTEKLNETEDNLVNYMWTEYEMSYSQAKELQSEGDISLTEYKKIITGLKGKIRALGDVNINAIEDYKEVGERYEFMKGQYDDLMKAKESLMGIIDELDTGMRKQFKAKFAEIQQEFDIVFKELFGGGKGEIILDTDCDVLEAGIHIISQPPGKKLQNMMQMSGGEKALTAISLLFAIQNLKPSPFCLLDEIEAALDDSNVTRYAEYLHKLTEHTQFIVITHRRGTMNAADRLYGITMQEKGISTLVSVDLLEAQLDEKKE